MNVNINRKIIIVCLLIFSLMIYCVDNILETYDIEFIDKEKTYKADEEKKAKYLYLKTTLIIPYLMYYTKDIVFSLMSFRLIFIKD